MSQSLTLVFPGQGSQYVGMGLWPTEKKYQDLFKKADSLLSSNLSEYCFHGPADVLKLTENTQPALFTHSVALYHFLMDIITPHHFQIERVLGHSVGEYAALYAAGTLDFEVGVKAVRLRGKAMQAAVPPGKGKMFAILKTDPELITLACREVSMKNSEVMPANFNGPDQIVISGESEACLRAIAYMEEKLGRVRAMELPVSAPFHSSLMLSAEQEMSKFFDSVTLNSNKVPYIANVDALDYPIGTDPKTIEQNLLKQICGSVRWSQSIERLESNTKIIEVGPGKVLSGLIKKINPTLKVHSIDQGNEVDSMQALKLFLELPL